MKNRSASSQPTPSTSRRSVVRRDPSAMTCPICGTGFLLDETQAPPFCSVRCKQIDLGRWLDEEIGLPHEGEPDPEMLD
nr:DNA gyrase inhibitor YacG [Crateriforma conspicua]